MIFFQSLVFLFMFVLLMTMRIWLRTRSFRKFRVKMSMFELSRVKIATLLLFSAIPYYCREVGAKTNHDLILSKRRYRLSRVAHKSQGTHSGLWSWDFNFFVVPNLFENRIININKTNYPMRFFMRFQNEFPLCARCCDNFYFFTNLYILDTKLNEVDNLILICHIV